MSGESRFLAGKVAKRSLPAVRGPSGPDTPSVKRLFLPQGELAQFYDGDEPVRYIAFIELLAGTVRGNHYHKVKEEWLYVIQGQVRLELHDLGNAVRDSVLLEAGDLAIIPTGIAHALRVITPGQAVEFSPARFDPADIYRFPL